VVMLVDPSILPIARRLTLEIESLGLTVEQVSTDSPHASFLKDQALAAGAVAAIYLAPNSGSGAGGADMTILDGATGSTVTWKVAAPTPEDPAPLDLVATRTVELLRASLLDLAARRAAQAEAAARAQRARQAAQLLAERVKEPEERLAISVGPGLLYSPHLRPGAMLQSSAVWLPAQHFGLAFTALLPMGAARLESAEGAVDVSATLYRLGPVVAVSGANSAVSLRMAAGLELDWLRLDGGAYAPHHGATSTRNTWSPFAAATTRFRVARGCYVLAELAAALAFPTTVVRVADREVANWGRPLVTAALGIELTWPNGAAR
jgi:hypothetical protein